MGYDFVMNFRHGNALYTRLTALFQDREIFVRTGGHVSFLKLSAKVQKQVAGTFAAVVAVLLMLTGGAVARDLLGAADRAELARKQSQVGDAEAKVAAYRDRVGTTADELTARQEHLETLTREFIGANETDAASTRGTNKPKATPISANAALDPVHQLASFQVIERRQLAYATSLTAAVDVRASRAEGAIRRFGIDPSRLSRSAFGVGGPFEPYRARGREIAQLGDAVVKLDHALARMERLESALVAIPSDRPADVAMVTSSYGYRRDPFTGTGAFHSGLDFRGQMGTPIHAASAGRVSFTGVKAGYGNTVEVDHGQGMITRYAHLSGFDVRPGQSVRAGDTIARMGSTGRSTGPHLHFEVRMNGLAMNPRTFLEANKDVLKIKAVAQRRITQRAGTRPAPAV